MGIAAPPQVRRVVDYAVDQGIKRFAVFAPQTSYGQQMARTLESQAPVRGATGVAIEFYDANSADLGPAARRLAAVNKGDGRLAVLGPQAPPPLSAALPALSAAAIAGKWAQ